MSAVLVRAVFEEYGPALHRYLVRRLSDAQTARDLAQEVYVRLLGIPNDELLRSPQAYVFRIASNLVYERYMRERRAVVRFDSRTIDHIAEQVHDPDAQEPGEQIDIERQLERLLGELPPLYAAILTLKKHEGMSYEEIARELNISVHTVKKYLAHAIATCRTSLQIQP